MHIKNTKIIWIIIYRYVYFLSLSFVDEKISLSPLALTSASAQTAVFFTIYHRENKHNFFSLDKENLKSQSRIFFLTLVDFLWGN